MNYYGVQRSDVLTFAEARAALGLSASALRAALLASEIVQIGPVKTAIKKSAIIRLGGNSPARSRVTDVNQLNDNWSSW